MARTVKEHEYAAKRNQILAAAQRLIYTKGYERIDHRRHPGGFPDRPAGPSIATFTPSRPCWKRSSSRCKKTWNSRYLPIVQDPRLSALEKLQRFFATLDTARTAQKAFIASLARVWFADENAIVREKVAEAIVERRAPLLRIDRPPGGPGRRLYVSPFP